MGREGVEGRTSSALTWVLCGLNSFLPIILIEAGKTILDDSFLIRYLRGAPAGQ